MKTGKFEMQAFATTPSAAPSTNYQTANKKYIDDMALAGGKQLFTSSGTFTAPTGVTTVYLTMVGGGGGGAGVGNAN